MLYLLLFILRLLPLFVLIRLQKKLGEFNLAKQGVYIITTSLYFGLINLSMSLFYDYIFKYYYVYIIRYQWYGNYSEADFLVGHVFFGFIISVFFLPVIKYRSGDTVAVFLKAAIGVSLAAFLTLWDYLGLILPK